MQAREFMRALSRDRANLVERLLQLIDANSIQYCVIGGVAVSAYVEPLVSLELDLIITNFQLGRFESLLASTFHIRRQPRFIEITLPGSEVRVLVHTEPRYAEFIPRSEMRPVLGMRLRVARAEDVLRGKIWAFEDTGRRGVKRQKDLLDIARLLEGMPQLKALVPLRIQSQLQAFGA